MLSKKSFADQMLKLNSILSDSAKIENFGDLDVYYAALAQWSDDELTKGVNLLLSDWKFSSIKPTPGNISEYIRKASGIALDDEEQKVVAEVTSLISVADPVESIGYIEAEVLDCTPVTHEKRSDHGHN